MAPDALYINLIVPTARDGEFRSSLRRTAVRPGADAREDLVELVRLLLSGEAVPGGE